MADKPDLNALMQKAQEMQNKMQSAQNELSAMEVTGESGGGVVKIVMTGRHDARKVIIDPNAIQEGQEVLEDLIAAAVNDAVHKVEKAAQEKMMTLTKDMGLPPDIAEGSASK